MKKGCPNIGHPFYQDLKIWVSDQQISLPQDNITDVRPFCVQVADLRDILYVLFIRRFFGRIVLETCTTERYFT